MKGLPKKYAKMGFAKGWRAYKASKNRKTSSPKPKTRKIRKKGGVRTAKKKRRVSRSSILGNVGIKGLIMGTAALTAAKYLGRRFLPVGARYVQPLAMVGTSFLPISGVKAMRQVGLMDLGSELINDLMGSGGLSMGRGGYDA